MRFLKTLALLWVLAAAYNTATAQRYLTPQFSSVNQSALTPYGFNYTVLPVLFDPTKHTVRQPLVMQVYSPVGDTETKRPLIIYLHTGNFFPFPQNNSCGGNLNDSSNVEFATRLAKMGYVVAVADYRLGWAPTATTETTRRFTLINAAYRGLQDVSTCIRFFRKNVAEGGNTYGIDPNKIVVWGQGTGGYPSLASAYLNKFGDIYTTSDPNKFVIINPALPGGKYNMVQEAVNGDLYATTGPTKVDPLLNAVSGGLFKIGDTLCIPNHVGYPSNFQLCVNMGGALGDSTWLDKGDIPLISYHVPT
ncbi:MAG TPA: alpha/beta hydrolase, partial [Saprospiraceae bacterium]|nr:alpha/beta hydrolase [Saprospiraceae bacterium]